MDRIKRLVIRARAVASRNEERFQFGTVKRYKEEGPYIARAFTWTGKPRSGKEILSEHKTEQEALDALKALYEEYPNSEEDVVIFYGGYDLLD